MRSRCQASAICFSRARISWRTRWRSSVPAAQALAGGFLAPFPAAVEPVPLGAEPGQLLAPGAGPPAGGRAGPGRDGRRGAPAGRAISPARRRPALRRRGRRPGRGAQRPGRRPACPRESRRGTRPSVGRAGAPAPGWRGHTRPTPPRAGRRPRPGRRGAGGRYAREERASAPRSDRVRPRPRTAPQPAGPGPGCERAATRCAWASQSGWSCAMEDRTARLGRSQALLELAGVQQQGGTLQVRPGNPDLVSLLDKDAARLVERAQRLVRSAAGRRKQRPR